MRPRSIKKAVFPVAGLGTRFLPATKANPKEILPIVDKPLIQYAVEEAIAAGISEIIFVTSSAKRAIEDHFDKNAELEAELARQGKHELLTLVKNILPSHVSCAYIRQPEPRGLGHAVLCAKPLVGNEPFAVLLADDLIDAGDDGCLSQMVRAYERVGGQLLAAQRVPQQQVNRYGICEGQDIEPALKHLTHLVEKPHPKDAPSNLAVIGRYVLQPGIFSALQTISPGSQGEIQLTDAINATLSTCPTYAFAFQGTRYDCGSKHGYVQATIAYALKDPYLRQQLLPFLNEHIDAVASE